MRYAILSTLIFFSFLYGAYASPNIEMSIDKNNVIPGENFTLTLEFTGSDFGSDVDYEVEGLENFEIFSRGQQFQFQNIMGEVQSKLIIQLQLLTEDIGAYEIGPVLLSIGDENHRSDALLTLIVSENIPVPNIQTRSQTPELPTLSGLIQPERTSPLVWYVFLVLILSAFLSYIIQKLYILTNIPQSSKIEAHNKQALTSLYEKYFYTLKVSDSSDEFMKKYLSSTLSYLTENESSHREYLSLTLSEIELLNGFQDYKLKNDFIALYNLYYKGEELSEGEKSGFIDTLKQTTIDE